MVGHKKCVILITIACVSDRVSRYVAILEEWKPLMHRLGKDCRLESAKLVGLGAVFENAKQMLN